MVTKIPKKTQGELKMERYIEDLIRNEDFRRKIKRLRKSQPYPKGMYSTWTDEERKKSDYINNELGSILDAYEKLRKRCNKLMRDRYSKTEDTVSEKYSLDGQQINYVKSLTDPEQKKYVEFAKSMADLDMCKVWDFNSEELSPANKGEEIIHLNRQRQLFLRAYPVGIFIHPKASKRDALDFVEKRWLWIEYNFLRTYAEKKLKYGKRRHSQKLLDFIWSNRLLPIKQLQKKIDYQFPNNGLIYYEIPKILQLEKQKRLGNLS